MANAVERFVLAPDAAAPDNVAVLDAPTGEAVTRSRLTTGVRRAAAWLQSQGVQPEQRVVLAQLDRADFLCWFWGAMWIGAVPVPVSTMLTSGDYAFLLGDSRAVGLVVSPELRPTLEGAIAGQRHLRVVAASTLPQDADPLDSGDPFPATDDDVAFWLYTSGTTGFPKAARHRHVDLGACTDAYARGVLDLGPTDRAYSVAKLFFAYGLGNAGYFPAGTGATAVLNPSRPTPDDVADHVRTHQPTVFFGVPTFYAALLNTGLAADTFASVRIATSAGEALPAHVHGAFRERFGVEILDGIGTTEIAHIFLSNRAGRSVPGTSGTPVDGYEIELRSPDGAAVADGEPGDLWVAGESVTVGYWNRTELNRRVLHGRFIATGDQYVRDPDGRYTYLGRTDDMLKVSGMWVSPAEVEAAIAEMPEIVHAAVVGMTDEDELVKPRAFVVPADGADPGELPAAVQAHVKSSLAPYKYPRWVEVVAELPMTATGKVQRYLLRQRPLVSSAPAPAAPSAASSPSTIG